MKKIDLTNISNELLESLQREHKDKDIELNGLCFREKEKWYRIPENPFARICISEEGQLIVYCYNKTYKLTIDKYIEFSDDVDIYIEDY